MTQEALSGMLAGALAAGALLALLGGALAGLVPSEHPLGPVARILDSLAPWLLGAAMVLAIGAALFGLRGVGAGLAVLAALAGAQLALGHRALSLPLTPERAPDLRILFFNAYEENTTDPARIVAAAQETGADIIVFAEAEMLRPALPALAETHEILTPCPPTTECELMIASRVPVTRSWTLTLNPIWADRYGVVQLSLPDGRAVSLAAAHLVKPFFTGVAEAELARLTAQYEWLDGPVLAVGDFNAAPWSRPVRQVLETTGFRALRRPPGTWPAGAGRWGIPIDQAHVAGGLRVTGVTAFGAGLGSNHRGLILEVHVPPEDAAD
ncbi:MAG: endonuclease/exonuclease/phosphatase family protein [Pseudomonadota bacterium]